MAAPTVVQALSGATLAISASIPATYDAAGYGASSMVYTEIGEIENHGTHGMSATITEFTPVDTATVTKVKGSKNYGNKTLTLGSVPSQAGQVLLDEAAESNNHYSLKMTYPSGAIHYMDVLIAKAEYINGAVNDVTKRSFDAAVCRKPVVVPAV